MMLLRQDRHFVGTRFGERDSHRCSLRIAIYDTSLRYIGVRDIGGFMKIELLPCRHGGYLYEPIGGLRFCATKLKLRGRTLSNLAG